jgi:hypothetical protein
MDYKPTWNLASIPEPEWKSENGRRSRSKAKPYQNLKPCSRCKTMLNTAQRRDPCPTKGCGWKNTRRIMIDGHMTDIPNPYLKA